MKLLIIGILAMLLISCGRVGSSDKVKLNAEEYYMKAPEFPSGMDWLNTDRALKVLRLRGKVVLLDFWTYCCINCIHIIPDLKRLEREFADELVVIGVHSAKFAQERDVVLWRECI